MQVIAKQSEHSVNRQIEIVGSNVNILMNENFTKVHKTVHDAQLQSTQSIELSVTRESDAIQTKLQSKIIPADSPKEVFKFNKSGEMINSSPDNMMKNQLSSAGETTPKSLDSSSIVNKPREMMMEN